MDKFNYVIARKWFPNTEDNRLNCYTYHNTVFYGTIEEAIESRDFMRDRADVHANEFEIYKISDEPLKID